MQNQPELTELLQMNLRALNRFVLSLVRDEVDAAEVVQKTATKAFLHFAQFRAEANFKTWLMSIALNEVRQLRRRQSRSRIFYLDHEQLIRLANARSEKSPDREYEELENARRIHQALSSLHPAYERVIYLRVFQGLCVADAARELSLSVSAVKARYHRAIRQLAKDIARKTRPTLISRRHRNLGAAAVAIRRLNCPAV